MIETRTYYGTPGASSITDPYLAYRQIIRVCREGLGYTETDGIPSDGERTYLYEPDAGRIVFDPENPFSSIDALSTKVFVILNV